MARAQRLGGVECHVSSRRACARLGADRGCSGRHCASSRPATTRTSADPTCAPFELFPATCSSPKRRSACRCSAMAMPEPKSTSCCVRSRCFRSARIWSAPIRSARRSASSRSFARPATTSRSICMARWREITRYYDARGIDLGELRAGARREEGRACRRDRALAALRVEGSVDAAVSRSGDGICVGLDARARPRAPARRRVAAGHFRSRRLGWAVRDDCGDRRVADLGHAWRRGSAGALVARAASRRGRSAWSAMATRRRATDRGSEAEA